MEGFRLRLTLHLSIALLHGSAYSESRMSLMEQFIAHG